MHIPLSSRLLACCNFIKPGDRVADVGCDHGYLGIWLLTQGIARSVIAADVRQGPLESAKRNASKFGTASKMSFHLSDGVQSIPRDFDVLVCAGMGGDTMVSILEAAPWLQNSAYRLILQCQSKTPLLRSYLSDKGWCIHKETVLRDGKFRYTIMEILWDPTQPRLTHAQTYLSPALLTDSSPDLPDYCQWVIQGLEITVRHQNDPDKAQLLAELKAIAPKEDAQ